VLRVFGVRNLLRALREVPRPRWDACVRTLVHEARMRLADPVRGCVGAIEDLEAQLVDTAVELEVLRRRQEAYRQAKKRRGLRWFRPADPGEAAARQQPGTGRTRGDSMIQPQDPYGAAWQPATAGLAATQARLSPTQPQVLSSWAATTLRDAAATTVRDAAAVLADAATTGNASATHAEGNSDGTRRLRQRVGKRRRAG